MRHNGIALKFKRGNKFAEFQKNQFGLICSLFVLLFFKTMPNSWSEQWLVKKLQDLIAVSEKISRGFGLQ